MHIDLSVPEEPADLQRIVAENVAQSQGNFDPNVDHRLPINPSPGRVILGTEIQTYLWRAWNGDLQAAGFTYLDFQNTLTYAGAALAHWAVGETEWTAVIEQIEEAITEIGEELVDPLGL